ncbi:MAG: 23S rRNA (guanosine(2251)-2'-O)-methyltransferase RlmB [Myxococcales bacterium]|nr:23S rRNA (guanosine(2251)-2'-O)-methyltransferase RlmB [Myxococcales bacterium]
MSRVITGPRFVREAVEGPRAGELEALYIDAARERSLEPLAEAARARGVPVEYRPRAALDRLAHGVRHQGAVAVARAYGYVDPLSLLSIEAPLLVALDEVTDPHNFGAIIRSAVAFGADGVVVPKRRSATVTPVVVRASAGATEHARIAPVTNLSRFLLSAGAAGIDVVGLAADGDLPLSELGPAPLGRVFVIGSEGRGLRRLVRERCGRLVFIPQTGPIASLNASVAAGVALYEASRSRIV